jgi:hypothetical protein
MKNRWHFRITAVILLFGYLQQHAAAVTAFQMHACSKGRRSDSAGMMISVKRRVRSRYYDTIRLHASSPDKKQKADAIDKIPAPSSATSTIYKDDCFGFTSFIAGFAVQDFTFTGIFVSLSLLADVLTRVGLLPPDPKRPEIVDRRVPGAIAILTLGLSFSIDSTAVDVESSALVVNFSGFNLAQSVQLVICSFSAITAFGDIRWRDRFDYPSE